MKLHTKMRIPALVVALAAAAAAAAGPETAVIRSGVPWYDTDGNRVFAGGANMYVEGGVYYLIGEGKKVLSGVSMSWGGGCPQLQSVAQHTGCALRRPPRSSGPLSPPPNTRARLRRTSPRASICTAARTFRPGSSKAARSTTGAGPARPPRAALAPPQARPARTPPVHWPS